MLRTATGLTFIAASTLFCVLAGCGIVHWSAHADLIAMAEQGDPLVLSDTLELLIAFGDDTSTDRSFAYEEVKKLPADSAAEAYARANVTGRYVQNKGYRAVHLLKDVEKYARRSRELDPGFRDGAATLLLGTLYVLAPSPFLEHGNSEVGLEMLEELVDQHPEAVENHLRLAEGYLALGDPEPAFDHLCLCLARAEALRPDDAALLEHLVADTDGLTCPAK